MELLGVKGLLLACHSANPLKDMSRQKKQLAAIQCSLECLAILIYTKHHWAIFYL